MKECPFCAEAIEDGAVFCRHCRRDLPVCVVPSATHAVTRMDDSLVIGQNAAAAIADFFGEVMKNIFDMGQFVEEQVATLQDEVEDRAGVTPWVVAGVSSMTCDELHRVGESLEWKMPDLQENVSVLVDFWTSYIDGYSPARQEETDTLNGLRGALAELLATSHTLHANIVNLRDSIVQIGGMSPDVGRESQYLSQQLEGLMGVIGEIGSFAFKTAALIQSKMAEGA